MKNGYYIIIDRGHGVDTYGKQSPDGMHHEWKYCDELAKAIKSELDALSIPSCLLVEDEYDMSLQLRVDKANQIASEKDKFNTLLVSLHTNAFGNDWNSATGWRIFTSPGETISDKYASIFIKNAQSVLAPYHKTVSKQDFDENFYIITKSTCPAVLTENFFHTNRDDLKFIHSKEGFDALVKIHVDSIIEIGDM